MANDKEPENRAAIDITTIEGGYVGPPKTTEIVEKPVSPPPPPLPKKVKE